ncbi:MAG: hypothetical protein Q4C10_06440 [Clostridia bacterium]|nr:hypothetical protein [Clostridia bacterium]
MKISRISLFVLGYNGGEFADEGKRVRYSAAELMKDIKGGVSQLCELGSEEAVCFTVFDGQFKPGLDAAIGGVRANPRAITAGVQATQLYAIYLINSARSEQEWARCIRETADSVRNLAFTQISHIAIVQKDGLRINDPELVEALENVNAAVYLFSQSTRAGWVLASANEERKLLSNYAILAACGMLPDTYGVYTGTFNKLSLMREDFRRIRVHYAVKALTTRAREDQSLNEDTLFTSFFGSWPNGNVNRKSDAATLGRELKRMVEPLFPNRLDASIMANAIFHTTDENIDRFIEVNFKGGWMRALLARFNDEPVSTRQMDNPAAILGNWSAYFDQVMEDHPEYYCRDVIEYLRRGLIPWLEDRSRRLRAVKSSGVSCEEKDPIAYAVVKTERMLEPYYDHAAGALLAGVARLLERKIEVIQEAIHRRDEIIAQNKWLLSEGELREDIQFAESIINRISSNSRRLISPELSLKPAADYFGDDPFVEENWVRLVDRLQQSLIDDNEQSMVTHLAKNVEAAQFTATVNEQLQDLRERLQYDTNRIYAQERQVIYMCSDLLHAGDANHPLPKQGPRSRVVEVRRFDNLVEFTVCGLGRSDNEQISVKELLDMLPETRRIVNMGGAMDEEYGPYDVEEAQESTEGPTPAMLNATLAVQGDNLLITLPKELLRQEVNRPVLHYKLSGYSRDGVRIAPKNHQKDISGEMVIVPLEQIYGYSRIELSCKALNYQEVIEFESRKSPDEIVYSKKRPLLGRQKNVNLDDDRQAFEHWVCKLEDKNVRSINAMVMLQSKASVPLYYPLGEAGKWDIWTRDSLSGEFYLADGGEARLYTMREKE